MSMAAGSIAASFFGVLCCVFFYVLCRKVYMAYMRSADNWGDRAQSFRRMNCVPAATHAAVVELRQALGNVAPHL
jgi:hypothetical protein